MTEKTPVNEEYTGPGSDQTWGEPEFKRYLNILRRRIWVVVTCFVIIASLGIVHAFRLPPIYRAEARILIEKRGPHVMEFEDVLQLQASDQQYYRTQEELVKSRAVLEKAFEQPGMRELFEVKEGSAGRPSLMAEIRRTISAVLGNPPVALPEPWERLRGMVKAEFLPNTHLLLVIVESGEPAQATDIANAVANGFEQYHAGRKLETSNEVFRFLGRQQVTQVEALREAEDTLQQFREKAEEVSLDVADKGNPVLVKLGRLDAELTKVQLARIAHSAQFEVVKQALSTVGTGDLSGNEHLFSLPALQGFPIIKGLRSDLMAAEQEPRMLSMIYGPEHPQLRTAQARVDMLRERLRDALAHVNRSVLAQLEILNKQEEELQEQYVKQNRRALAMARQSLTFNRMQGEVQRQGKLLDILMERMREVDLTADYTRTNVEVVEAAAVPKAPAGPRKGRVALMSVVLGLLVGVGLAFLFEYLDDTIKTPEDLETRVGIPVLGFVPTMDIKGTDKRDFFLRRGSFALAEPTSPVTEAYRNIRTNLFFSAPPDEMKVLVVTSGGPKDGKTTTCANLAVVISQSAKRVLLVDGDLRRPMLHRALGLKSSVGLSNVLVGEASLEEAVQNPRYNGNVIDNLDVIVAGPKPPNPAELLGSESMRKLLEEARGKYDRVIVDTPPVLSVADGNILAGMSDGVIMVVKASKNTRSLARRAREGLNGVKARIVGGILNDVRVSRLGYYYSDYYYGYCNYYRSHY